jgi:hypothetical protein
MLVEDRSCGRYADWCHGAGPRNRDAATFKIVGAHHITPYMISIGP